VIKNYYSNKKLQTILWNFGNNREVVARNQEGLYFKRPSVLQYPADIQSLVCKGAVSFHCSVEKWTNPLLLDKKEYNTLRTGFDWVIDIDSKLGIDEAKISAILVRDFLDDYNIKYLLKFSGRRGFHFCIFWENFPEEIDYQKTELLYPELPKKLSMFLREKIREELWNKLVEFKGSVSNLIKSVKLSSKNPFEIVEIEKDWSVRHLFRMPYSIHEKTNLVSIPINPKNLEDFKIKDAEIGNVKFENIEAVKGDISKLIIDAYDFFNKQKEDKKEKRKEITTYKGKITDENFPPCISTILAGIYDGRKRSVFTLITFLRNCNFSWEEIENKIQKWCKKVNLPENYVKSQLSWHKKQNRKILPPNCNNDLFYKDIGICNPLPLCSKIKNPINFAIIYKKKNR